MLKRLFERNYLLKPKNLLKNIIFSFLTTEKCIFSYVIKILKINKLLKKPIYFLLC